MRCEFSYANKYNKMALMLSFHANIYELNFNVNNERKARTFF